MKGPVVHLQSLTWPVLFFIAGIASSFYDLFHHLPFIVPCLFGLLITSGVIWSVKNKQSAQDLPYLLALSLFFITGWGISQYQQTEFERYSSALSSDIHRAGTIKSISHFNKMDRIQVRIPSGHWWSPSHYFNINLLDKNHDFHKGQIISLSKPLSRITSYPLPYTFPAREYWTQHNTSHDVFIRDVSNIHKIHDSPDTYINQLRKNAASRIDEIYPDATQAGILKALLLGQKEWVSKDNRTDFKRAGLMHILAVSGLHVGIVSALLVVLLFPIRLMITNSWVHYTLLIGGLWVYAAITGMNTPVVRAVILMTFYLIANKIDRQIDKWNIYFWAVLLVLMIHPMALFTVSFQLSFGAVAAILFFYKHFHKWVIPLLGRNYFSGLVAVSLAAQAGILPLLLFHFQEISLVSTLSSFLVIPLLFPLILISAISILIPASWHWITAGLAKISEVILDIITGISGLLASWDFSSQTWVLSPVTLIFLFLAMVLGGLYLEFRKNLTVHPILYGILGCILLAGICEGVNIYLKRNQVVLVTYEINETPVTDLYYRGICYTNCPDQPPSYIDKNRKRYYSNRTVPLPDRNSWQQLFTAIYSSNPAPLLTTNNPIQVFDYVNDQSYNLENNLETYRDISNPQGNITPVFTSYNPE